MLCSLRALLFKNSWYHYVILQRWGKHCLAGQRQVLFRYQHEAQASGHLTPKSTRLRFVLVFMTLHTEVAVSS